MGERAEYQRRWRAENPDRRAAERAACRARGRAMTRLVELHRDEFARLQDEERAAEGLPPAWSAPFGSALVVRSERAS